MSLAQKLQAEWIHILGSVLLIIFLLGIVSIFVEAFLLFILRIQISEAAVRVSALTILGSALGLLPICLHYAFSSKEVGN